MRVPQQDEPTPAETRLPGDRAPVTASQRRAGLAASLVLVVAGIVTLNGFLAALIWAVVFAIAVWPLFDRMARRWPRHRRALLPALFVAAVVLLFVLPVVIVAVPLITDAHAAAQWIAQAQQSGVPPPAALAHLPFGDRLIPLWQDEVGRPGQLSVLATHGMQGGLISLARVIGAQALHRLILLFFMLLTLFFLLRDAESVAGQVRIAMRRAFGPAGEAVGRQVARSVRGTVDGLVLVGLAEGLALGIAYALLGVPHPALFGLVTGLLAMIPFGAMIAFGLAALLLLAQGAIGAAIGILVAGSLVVFVADHFVRPVLIGGVTRLPFLWVLLGILGGVEAWGLVGLFVGPAIMAALILLWREWVGTPAAAVVSTI